MRARFLQMLQSVFVRRSEVQNGTTSELCLSLILLTCCLVAAGCKILPADPEGRPVAVALSSDGRLQYFAPLCPGEEVASVEVLDHNTGQVLWAASEPEDGIRNGGRITVGKSDEFRKVQTPLVSQLPDVLSVHLKVKNKWAAGAQVGIKEVPKVIAGTDIVMGHEFKKISEASFRARVEQEVC